MRDHGGDSREDKVSTRAPFHRHPSTPDMTNHLVSCSELRELPEEQHLFCPRVGDDGSVYYDEDVAAYPPETDANELADRKLVCRRNGWNGDEYHGEGKQ